MRVSSCCVIAVLFIVLQLVTALPEEDKDKNSVKTTSSFLWWTLPKIWSQYAHDRGFLRTRSNAMNPNHPTYNPTAQPRTYGPFASQSKARAAEANLNVQTTPTKAILGGGLFTSTAIVGRVAAKDGLAAVDGETVKQACYGFAAGSTLAAVVKKAPAVGPTIIGLNGLNQVTKRVSNGGSVTRAISEEVVKTGSVVGFCIAAQSFGGFLGSFIPIPVVGTVTGIAAGGALCGVGLDYAEYGATQAMRYAEDTFNSLTSKEEL